MSRVEGKERWCFQQNELTRRRYGGGEGLWPENIAVLGERPKQNDRERKWDN